MDGELIKRLLLILVLCGSAFGQGKKILGPILMGASAAGGGVVPALVQACTAATGSTGVANLACGTVGSAHAIVAVLQANNGACTGTSGIDSSPIGITGDSNTWHLAASGGDASFSDVFIFYALNSASGSTTTTFTCLSDLGQILHVAGGEFSGILTASALDKTASATYSFSIPVTGTTATTAQASELLIGGFGFALGNSVGVGSGWTITGSQFDSGQNRSVFMEHKVVAATGTYQATTTDQSGTYAGIGIIATFKGQ